MCASSGAGGGDADGGGGGGGNGVIGGGGDGISSPMNQGERLPQQRPSQQTGQVPMPSLRMLRTRCVFRDASTDGGDDVGLAAMVVVTAVVVVVVKVSLDACARRQR